MRCPACKTDNAADNTACASCGASLNGRPAARSRGPRRAVAEESDTPFESLGIGPNRPARLAYYLGVIGLIPGIGLLLGPAAMVLGAWAWWRGNGNPAFTSRNIARAALILGLLLTLTNWAGLALILAGWQSG